MLLVALGTLGSSPVKADFTFGPPQNLGPVINSSSDDFSPSISADGLSLYFSSRRPGGFGGVDLWVSTRPSTNAPWGTPVNVGLPVNSPYDEWSPSISSDGLTLFFSEPWDSRYGSLHPNGLNPRANIWMTTRPSSAAAWSAPVNLGPSINTEGVFDPSISADGLSLYFGSFWPGSPTGKCNIMVATRASTAALFGTPVFLQILPSTYATWPSISSDGRTLFYTLLGGPGGIGIWVTTRKTATGAFGPLTLLPDWINAGSYCPNVSADGSTLYFTSASGFGSAFPSFPGLPGMGSADLWQASILPVVDLNGDGKVDEQDVQVLRAHRGSDDPHCDIGPMPWGDGIVDMEDLKVLLKHVKGADLTANPLPYAWEVPAEVILSWVSPPSAKAHDVYFGTSVEAVSSADRANPKGVLVSKGQTTTTYDPPGLLAYGQTYYWRVDEVDAPPDSMITKGSVWEFTTEALAYPIKNVTAKASSAQAGSGPERTVDGSGLDANGGHSTDTKDMWMSLGTPPNWIQYEFDKVHNLHEMWVWNSNQPIESMLGFGARSVKIEYSTDGTTWTVLNNVPEFSRAPGKPAYAANTKVSFGGVLAKSVKLTIDRNWGGIAPQTGLSEVRFFYLPVQAKTPQPADGQTNVNVDATLSWQAGRGMVSHRVYFGTDRQAVAGGTVPAATASATTFHPDPLDFGRTYYWRVDEVDTATYPGETWSFSTCEYAVVENFESYTDNEGSRIFDTWIDGWTNATGARVGYAQSPFSEHAVVHGGGQSMPLEYNNAKTPFYSEAGRTFGTPQNWMAQGADTLSLYLHGYPLGFVDKGGNAFALTNSGTDVWDLFDQFRFAFQRLSGSGSIVARVDSVQRAHAWSKAGVMIRESLDAGSRHAFCLITPDNGKAFQNRRETGGFSANSNTLGFAAPYWVKLVREGDRFSAYHSPDGVPWTLQAISADTGNPQTIFMAKDVYIGLAVTSHNGTAYCTAEFSHVATTGAVTGPWQSLSIGVTQPSNAPAPLYLVVEDDTGKSAVAKHLDPAATQLMPWVEWKVPLSGFTGVNLAKVKKMRIGVGDRKNPAAGGSGLIFIDDIGVGHPLSSQ